MAISIPIIKYICIDFPAIVNDHRKAIETLGNECKLSEVFNDKRKRLELKFRWNDEHSRGVYGDHCNCNSIVLKVRRKKYMQDNNTLHVEIMAYVDTIYSFKSLCDYQYQPIERINATNEYRSLQPYLAINGFHNSSWLFENVPAFIPSPHYSRYDKQFDLRNFLKGQRDLTSEFKIKPKNYNWKSYKRNYSMPCPQVTEEILGFQEEICKNSFTKCWYLKVKEKFDKIPIWTTHLISSSLNINSLLLKKKIISSVAYYFSDGPWGRTWVRYGYDPLLDPMAKKYQTMECRFLRYIGKARSFKDKSSLQVNSSNLQEEITEANYKFVPNELPTFCHVCYMLYNTEHAEIQRLLHLNDGMETICTEKDGWLLAGTIEKCRIIIKTHFQELKDKIQRDCPNSETRDDENVDKNNASLSDNEKNSKSHDNVI